MGVDEAVGVARVVNSAVNAAAEVFGEAAEDATVDRPDVVVCVQVQRGVHGAPRRIAAPPGVGRA